MCLRGTRTEREENEIKKLAGPAYDAIKEIFNEEEEEEILFFLNAQATICVRVENGQIIGHSKTKHNGPSGWRRVF